jgi:hypothetical protein
VTRPLLAGGNGGNSDEAHETAVRGVGNGCIGIGGLGLAGFGLAAGTAQAQPAPMVCQDPNSPPGPENFCTYQWCPGSPVMRNMPNWDMTVCHPWYFDPNSPLTNSTIIEGFPDPPPPRFYGPCPPLAFLCP